MKQYFFKNRNSLNATCVFLKRINVEWKGFGKNERGENIPKSKRCTHALDKSEIIHPTSEILHPIFRIHVRRIYDVGCMMYDLVQTKTIVPNQLKFFLSFFLLFIFFGKTTTAQCTLSCNGNVTIALDGNGTYQASPMTLLTNPLCDLNDFTIQLQDENGNPISSTITCDYVGQTLTGTITSLIDGNTCWGSIQVNDNLAPSLQCSDTYIFCYENSDPNEIVFPNVSDNCTPTNQITLNYTDNFIDLPCFSQQDIYEITARTERTWFATDEFGNTTTCLQNIYFKRVTTSDVTFPINKDDFESPALDCSQDPTNLTLTGQPTINGAAITSGGLCELAISHTDQIFNLCGTGGYKIIRTWTAVDWCSSDFILDAQVINVEDSTPPALICPADITVGTTSGCTASVTLPFAAANDDCSNHNITVAWQFGNGFGPFPNVPEGTYPATYSATDDCGNTATCTIQVTVEDATAPIAICESSIVVNLQNDGTAIINTTSFDNGSYDNCTLGNLEISKNGIDFSNTIQLDCSDIGQNSIPVTLRVYDVMGNINECTSMVNVEDKIAPIIICPLATTLHCTDDFLDLSISGNVIATDNCTLDSLFFQDEINLNSCSVGMITRTWTALDNSGNTTSCIQIITVEDNTILEINFPPNIDLTGCNTATTSDVTGEPNVMNSDCESVGISHNDIVFDNEPGLCQKILRTWTVVDWCVYEPNSGNNNGFYTFVQIIKIIDDGSSDIFSVAGVLTSRAGVPLDNITMQLQSANLDTTQLTNSGIYDFSNISLEDNFTLTPIRDGDDRTGVNTIDMVLIRLHILNLNLFNSPYQYLAADVNHSGTVTTFDLVIIRRVILNLLPEFPGESWRFIDADYIFSNPDAPLQEDFPTFKTFSPTVGEEYNFDFIAIKKGDVN